MSGVPARRSALVAAWAACVLATSAVWAQNPTGMELIPSREQHSGLAAFYEGEWRDALKLFEEGGRGAIKGVNGRWIDSICYHAMTGECYYQMGQPAKATEHFQSAIQQYLQYSQFMIQVQWPILRPSGRRVDIPWGRASAPMVFADIPDRVQIGVGNVQIVGGGARPLAIDSRRMIPIDVTEIVRCLAHAIRRYGELRGPLAPEDPVLKDLLTALMKRPVPPGKWPDSWMDVLLGCTFRALGKPGDAVPLLKRGQTLEGQYVHPLTGVALVELGLIALADGDFKGARVLFEEASYPAAFYGEIWGGPMLLEETFSYAHIAHELANRKQQFAILSAVGAWARRNKYYHLFASAGISAAENLASLGQTPAATQTLGEVGSAVARKDMMKFRPGARWNHISAIVHYQNGRIPAGDESLESALAYQRSGGSLWLFHITQVDAAFVAGNLTPRAADALFERVLRDPQPLDWMLQPLEALSVASTAHESPYYHWFEVCLERKDTERALEVADRLRRHRFFGSMKLGGRLVGLRWLLENPENQADQKIAMQRRDILLQYPEYQQRMDQARQVRAALSQMPLVAEDAAGKKAQQEQLAALAKLSIDQEALLRQIAVRREPASMVFPPLVSTKAVQQAMPEGQVLLIFLATPRALHGFLMDKQSYATWKVNSPATITAKTKKLLKEMGNHDANRSVPLSELVSEDWKKSADELRQEFFRGNAKLNFPPKMRELVVVPDGPLWYLPFEALQIPDAAGKPQSLISLAKVRYAPTLALAVADTKPRRRASHTAVVVGRLYPGQAEPQAQQAFEALRQALPGTVALPAELPAPSAIYSTLFERLVVLDDIPPAARPYELTPITSDKGPLAMLDGWLMLPWGGPEQVILPGFHTPAETSLKEAGTGQELFFSVCGLMASGARTVLISRWRVGGKTSYDQVREFVQELPYSTAAEAWQRAVFLSMEADLVPEQEPRVVPSTRENQPKTAHPFFWAGTLVVDTGAPPLKDDMDVNAEGAPNRNAAFAPARGAGESGRER